MDYYEKNNHTGQMERVTPRNIVTYLVDHLISPDEAVRRIEKLISSMEYELITPVDKADWKEIYDFAKENWAKYDGFKPTGDDLKEIRKIIKSILKDELQIEPHGDFMRLNKLTYHKYRRQIEELLNTMI